MSELIVGGKLDENVLADRLVLTTPCGGVPLTGSVADTLRAQHIDPSCLRLSSHGL